MNGISSTALHIHTEYSAQDGAQKIGEMVARVKELGATSVTLTDHGNLMGLFEFMSECKKQDINGIPGVEAYVEEDGEKLRKHLILLAKDEIGLKAISKAVTQSNHRMFKDFPRMNKDILERHFGYGTKGHGHVIATSACCQGVLASVLDENSANNAELASLQKKLDKLTPPDDPQYVALVERIYNLGEEIKELRNEKKGETDENVKKSLDAQIKVLSAEKSAINKNRAKIASHFDRYDELSEQIANIKSNAVSDKDLFAKTKDEALYYEKLFGKGNFFIEIQYHGLETERLVFPKLIMIANMLDIPMVAANDAHFCRKEDYRKRALVVANRYKKELVIRDPDKELYIKDDDELTKALLEITTQNNIDKMFANLKILGDSCHVELVKESHFPKYNKLPDGVTSKEYIKQLAYEGISKRYPNMDGWDDEHQSRLDFELDIIDMMGYNDYHLIVQDYLNYGRKLGMDCPEGVGYTVGPGRGSAVGSIVCYLLGITSLDPIKYNLYFERYLNPERVSMPDIDADFANSIRQDAIEYMRQTYGENAICGIRTKSTAAARKAVEIAGTAHGLNNNTAMIKGIKKLIPLDPGTSFSSKINDASNVTIADMLRQTYKDNALALEIVEDAVSIENLCIGYGIHAAGIIVSDNDDISDYVTLANTKKGWAAQCQKEEAENDVGVYKMDFLGLKNLDIMTNTIRRVKQNYGIKIDLENLPMEAEVFQNIFANGETDAVFQFESQGMKSMLKKFKPDCFEDLILLVAAYRPGPMQYLPDVISVKSGTSKATYSIKELEPILGSTYSKTIYQEQVQEIFKKLAGYSLGQADMVRRAMAKKKTKILAKERESFLYGDSSRNIIGCQANGIDVNAANQLFDELMEFAKYAFNKSHAAAYAFISYQTGWLKYHYPAEYMASVIETADNPDKFAAYVNVCRNIGINLRVPDVNKAQNTMSVKKNELTFGFSQIKGVGNSGEEIIAERKNGGFSSFKDFILRTNVNKTAINALIDAGSFDTLYPNRQALKSSYPELVKLKSTLNKTEIKVKELKDTLSQTDDEDTKSIKSLNRRLDTWTNKEEAAKIDIEKYKINNSYEDVLKKLLNEKDLLGSFITGNPLDSYEIPKNRHKIHDITDCVTGVHIVGMVSNLKILTAKKSGAEFAIFTLSDETGSINAIAFNDAYCELKGQLAENSVVSLYGDFATDTYGDEAELKFYVKKSAQTVRRKSGTLVIHLKNIVRWLDIVDDVKRYQTNGDGYHLAVFDESTKELRKTRLYVSELILNNSQYSIEQIE